MLNKNGSIDITIMSYLYCEPVGERILRERLSDRWSEVMTVLGRLIRRALIEDINKDSNGPVYKLTRKGERLLEQSTIRRMGS